ncbi:MAG: hypothetical protein ACE5OR_06765 [bacterium]
MMKPTVWLMFAAAFLLAHGWLLSSQFYHNAYDDAYISFRYALNFANGQGLVYNLGERVEGYTNFLWVVLLAFFIKAGLNVVIMSKILGVAFGLGTVILVFCFSQKCLGRDSPLISVPLSLLVLDSSFASSIISGMETALFAFLVTAGVFAYVGESEKERAFPFSSLIFAGASLARPEGMLFMSITLAHGILHGVLTSQRGWLKRALWSLSVFLILYVPYFLWRYNYYGYLLPNTFYAKTGGGWDQVHRGLEYLWHFLEARLGAVCLGLTVLHLIRRQFNFLVSYLLFVLISFTLYVIWVGGDWAIAHRFFVPVLPLIYLLISLGLKTYCSLISSFLPRRGRMWRVGEVALLVFLVISTLVTTSYAGEYRLLILRYRDVDRCRISMGRWLRENASPGATVAIFAAGEIPFYSELKSIDMLGMTDTEIAHLEIGSMDQRFAGHEKFDVDYTLSKRPDYVAFVAAGLDSTGMPDIFTASEYEQALLTHQEFMKSYRLLKYYQCSDGEGAVGVLFKRKEGTDP